MTTCRMSSPPLGCPSARRHEPDRSRLWSSILLVGQFNQAVEIGVVVRVRVEVSGHVVLRRPSHLLPKGSVGQQPIDRLDQARVVARSDQEPGPTVYDHFRDPAEPGGNYG